ncbi:MAG: hypothetical protein O9333_13250 [Beijerinckiaceae bacterium]|nr:hypothetical protein [Beijerinckiaceae bacterium]
MRMILGRHDNLHQNLLPVAAQTEDQNVAPDGCVFLQEYGGIPAQILADRVPIETQAMISRAPGSCHGIEGGIQFACQIIPGDLQGENEARIGSRPSFVQGDDVHRKLDVPDIIIVDKKNRCRALNIQACKGCGLFRVGFDDRKAEGFQSFLMRRADRRHDDNNLLPARCQDLQCGFRDPLDPDNDDMAADMRHDCQSDGPCDRAHDDIEGRQRGDQRHGQPRNLQLPGEILLDRCRELQCDQLDRAEQVVHPTRKILRRHLERPTPIAEDKRYGTGNGLPLETIAGCRR